MPPGISVTGGYMSGNNISRVRRGQQLRLSEVANGLGISISMLREIETGYLAITAAAQARLARALCSTVEDLFPHVRGDVTPQGAAALIADAETLDELAQAGLELDARQHRVQLSFDGEADPIFLDMPPASKRLLRDHLENIDALAKSPFCLFHAQDHVVLLNAAYLCGVHFVGMPPEEGRDFPPDRNAELMARAYLDTCGEPICFDASCQPVLSRGKKGSTGSEMYDSLRDVTALCMPEDWLSLQDLEGQRIMFRTGSLKLLLIPLVDVFAEDDEDDHEDSAPGLRLVRGGASA